MTLTAIGLIVGLIVLNGIYVAAEFAIVGARKSAIDDMVRAGSRGAARVAAILADRRLQDRYIATAQLGITLASLGLGMYGETALAGWLTGALGGTGLPVWLVSHAAASSIAILLLTYFHIVLGEMVPKAIALTHAERAAVWLTPAMEATRLAAYPLIAALNGIGNLLLRLLRLHGPDTAHVHTAAELQYIVRASEEGGALPHEAADVMEELLEFGQLTAGEVMVPRVRVRGVELGCPIPEIAAILGASPHTRYPVYVGDLDHIVGTIHIKDVLRRTRQGRPILQADIHPVPFIPETSTLDKVLTAMRAWHTQMVIVMDEHGGTAGLLTVEDVFEEVVGDIDEDTPGAHRPAIYRDADGNLCAAGTVRVDEIGEELDIELEHEDVDTLSGLVLALLDRPPRIGDMVTYRAVEVRVTAVEGHGVAECVVTLLPGPGPGPGKDDGHEPGADAEA